MAGFLTNLPADQVIAAQYIGYFNRAPDAEGFSYWALQYANAINAGVAPNTELVLIANQFVPQPETVALYPFLALAGPIDPNNPTDVAGVKALVAAIYENLFDRTVSTAELNGSTGAGYWVQSILGTNGQPKLAIGDAIIAIENGAVGVDATILTNKIASADFFVQHTAAAGMTQTPPGVLYLQEAHAVVKFIDATQESVDEAEAATAAFVANGGTQFTGPGANGVDGPALLLTTAQDTLTGYGHDVFNAPLSTTISGNPPTQIPTLQTGDSLIDISPTTGNVLNATFNPAQTGEFVTNTTTFTESITITESFVLTLAASFGIGEHGSFTFATSFGIAISESLSESQSQSFTFPVTGVNYVNATIEGIGTWNLTATTPTTVTAINGGPNVTGVNDIEMINSSGGFFDIGSTTGIPSGGNNFQPLQALVATISATNDTGGNKFWLSGIDVSQQESLFTPTTSVQINLSNAGSGPPATDTFSQSKVRGINQSLFIGDGPVNGSGPNGVVTWNIQSDGTFNSVFLDANATTSATTINIAGAGALTLFGNAPEFANVTTIAGGGTSGGITITGFLNDGGGLLGANNALTSFTGGSGNDLLDASGFTAGHLASLAAGAFDGGGGINEVILSNDVLTSGAPLTFLANFTIIGDAGDNGPNEAFAGVIDATGLTEIIFYGDLEQSATGLMIINAPATFTVNFQNFDFNDNAITIQGPANASVNNLTIEVGCDLNGSSAHGLGGPWVVTNYDNIDIQVIGHSFIGTHEFSDGSVGGFIATPAAGSGVTGVTVTLTGVGGSSVDDHGNINTFDHNLFFGNFDDATFADIGTVVAGSGGVALNGGQIIDNLGGSLHIGVTDASVIDASGATVNPDGDGGLFMENPDSNTITLTVTGASGSGIHNELQGSLGPIQAGSSVGDGTISTVNDINDTAFVGQGGPATINGGSDAGDYIFDTGGPETINLNNASGTDHVEYSMFDWNSDGYPFFALAITDDHGNYTGFDGHVSGPGLATINGFVVAGTTPDHLSFNTESWGFGKSATFGPNPYEGIVDTKGNTPDQGTAVYVDISSGDTVFSTNPTGNAANLIIYEGEPSQTTFANAAALETALNDGGSFFFDHSFNGQTQSILFAYANTTGGVNIADIQFNTTGSSHQINVDHAVDLATLNGVTLAGLAAQNPQSSSDIASIHWIH